MKTEKKHLRSGFTTGACAAAASKAALLKLLRPGMELHGVSIPFPDGSRYEFSLHSVSSDGKAGLASVIKDAGDDPDVTNGAEIGARVTLEQAWHGTGNSKQPIVSFRAGDGVGTVTRKGLAVPPGEPAINPGPRKMIRRAIREAIDEAGADITGGHSVEISIFVENGEKLAQNTLNPRLGIRGGISILGTTGIVRPVSAKAWTDTIDVCLNVARQAGLEEVILSTGRTSERAVQEMLDMPDEALVMMGDYLEYAMKAAGRAGFRRIHMAGMWAKIVKAALRIPQTHVRHGALDMASTARLLEELGFPGAMAHRAQTANTAREILEMLVKNSQMEVIEAVCARAGQYARELSGIQVTIYLVTPGREIIAAV